MREVEIGSRRYLVETTPIGNVLITEPILVVHGYNLLQLDYTSKSGWTGTRENIQYTNARVSELNGSNFYYTSTNELYKVIKTSSKSLNRRFNLESIN